jgi:hypothetical protein
MNDVVPLDLQTTSTARSRALWLDRRYTAPFVVVAASLLLFAVAMSGSFYNGRLAAPMTHDDVNFFVEGVQHLNLLRTEGFLPLVGDFLSSSLHAPIPSYQAMLAYTLFGIADWAPYASNLIWLLIFLGFAGYLLSDSPVAVLVAAMASLVALPLSSNTITEFAPEVVCSLFTSIGAVLMVRLPLIDAPLRARLPAAFFFAFAFLAHPTAFPFTLIALLASVGLAFLRDVVWTAKFKQIPSGIGYSLLNVLLSVWLPALYMVPRYEDYSNYFYDAVFNAAHRGIWYAGMSGLHLGFYLFGPAGQFMFGDKLLVYAGIICLGIAAAWQNKDRQLSARQAELLVLAFVFWMVPSLSAARQYLFASAFGFLIAFMTVLALQSIYQAVRGVRGGAIVLVLGGFLLALYRPSGLVMPNLPQTAIDREFAFRAIDRFKAVLLGNATNYRRNDRNNRVYLTNMGAFAPNILQYYLLKEDPALDWNFDTKWMDADPHHHIDFIHGSQADFVVTGEHGNGLTYSLAAGPAEDAVFAAMRRDDDYIAIDRFYGPGGRAIEVYQRRGNFAGWRPVSGIINPSGKGDDPRDIPQGLAYLQTFAARPIQADLEIEWAGAATGQKLDVVVNYQKAAESTFKPETRVSWLRQEISLSAGTNDIVLQSGGALKVLYLVIIPHLVAKAPDQDRRISVISATYGGNCGAPQGNATQDIAAICNGKADCAYPVKVERLGDPATGCRKDFTVSYFCALGTPPRHEELTGEAGFGSVAGLTCPAAGSHQ